ARRPRERLTTKPPGPLVRAGQPRGGRPAENLVPAAGRVWAVVRGAEVRPGVPVHGGRVRDVREHSDAGRIAAGEPGGPPGPARRQVRGAGQRTIARAVLPNVAGVAGEGAERGDGVGPAGGSGAGGFVERETSLPPVGVNLFARRANSPAGPTIFPLS